MRGCAGSRPGRISTDEWRRYGHRLQLGSSWLSAYDDDIRRGIRPATSARWRLTVRRMIVMASARRRRFPTVRRDKTSRPLSVTRRGRAPCPDRRSLKAMRDIGGNRVIDHNAGRARLGHRCAAKISAPPVIERTAKRHAIKIAAPGAVDIDENADAEPKPTAFRDIVACCRIVTSERAPAKIAPLRTDSGGRNRRGSSSN